MKKPIYALTLAGVLLLTGCAGTIKGGDSLEACKGVIQGTTTIFPSIETDTQVREHLVTLLKHAFVGEYKEAFDMLIVDDTTFVDVDDFANWFQNSGILANYTLTEDKRDKIKVVNVSSETGSYDFYPEKQEDGSWKYRVNELCVQDFNILIPTGIPAKLDGIDISKYAKGTEGNITTYTIPQITNAPHSLVIDTYFTEPLTLTIANCTTPFNASQYLAAPKSLRGTMIKDLASPTLASLTETIISQDWDKFCEFFTPDKNMQEYQQHFYKGKNKADVYGLELKETRDLETGDLDVQFTGYNTISVKFGTKWSWSAMEDVKFDKDGNFVSLNETRIKEMRIVNTLEFLYDEKTQKWYLDDIDTGSITLLAPGEEQWR